MFLFTVKLIDFCKNRTWKQNIVGNNLFGEWIQYVWWPSTTLFLPKNNSCRPITYWTDLVLLIPRNYEVQSANSFKSHVWVPLQTQGQASNCFGLALRLTTSVSERRALEEKQKTIKVSTTTLHYRLSRANYTRSAERTCIYTAQLVVWGV